MRFIRKYNTLLFWTFVLVIFLTFSEENWAQDSIEINIENAFTEDHHDFKFDQKNLRKWESPVIADLDQDGYMDILINNHGYSLSVCWNDKGNFQSHMIL